MSDTTLRHLETLRAIPRHPRKTTAKAVHDYLTRAGYQIDRRSVERDLHKLSESFPITCDEGARPVGWFWPAAAAEVVAPGLSTHEALEMELLARYLKPLLPMSSWASLEPRLEAARATLALLHTAPVARWRKRVAVIGDSPPLLSPAVPSAVIETVHDCLLHGRRFTVDYRAVDSALPKRFEVNPVALVQAGKVSYLVATLWRYGDLKHLALHRMSAPQALETPARQPKGFDLDVYLREQFAFDFPGTKDLRLVLRVSSWMARYLEERKLAPDQRISADDPDGRLWRVRATVRESERLVWWLRSHGEAVEVVKPAALRRRLAAEFAALAARYGTPST